MADTPPSNASSDSEIEEPKPIMLSEIPTLRYLFKNRTLVKAAKERFPYRADLLDRVSLYQGDITRLQVDSIVNAANRSLLGGGGVDGAIHDAAGPGLVRECATLGGASTGEAKITGGHRLPAKHIIHAVGPVYSTIQKDIKAAQLSACYSNSLTVALDNKLKSVAFCSISTGIYGYPIYDATHIALETTRDFLEEKKADSLERVIFVVWSNKDKGVYEELLPQYFPPSNEDTATAEPEAAKPEAEVVAEAEPETDHTGLSQEAAELDISSDIKKDEKDK